MYQPVFSLKTGWGLGEITDHTAHPINDSVRLDEICTKLNAAQDNIEAQHSSASPVQQLKAEIRSIRKWADGRRKLSVVKYRVILHDLLNELSAIE